MSVRDAVWDLAKAMVDLTTIVGVAGGLVGLSAVSIRVARRDRRQMLNALEGRRLMLIAARHPDPARRAQALRLLHVITLPAAWQVLYRTALSTAAAGSEPEPRAVAVAVQRAMGMA